MKALSVRQPWAHAIVHLGKRVENRDWAGCSYRGATYEAWRSPWYDGGFALVLADVEPLPFIPWKGSLGFFEVPDEIVAEALRAEAERDIKAILGPDVAPHVSLRFSPDPVTLAGCPTKSPASG